MNILRIFLLAGLVVVGMMFSLIAVLVLLIAGVCLWGYFSWKTRHLRKAMREQRGVAGAASMNESFEGQTIEGEIVYRESVAVVPVKER